MTSIMTMKGAAKSARKKSNSMVIVTARRMIKDKAAMIGLAILLVLIFISVFAPLIAPYDYTEMDFSNCYSGPSPEHWFGCDKLGRDYFSRVLYAGRYSLALGFSASLFSTVVGVIIGVYIGYKGGMYDTIGMRIMDVWAAIPGTLLAMVISTAMGAGFVNTVIAMTIGDVPRTVRSIRAMCLKERNMEYLEAAVSINCRKWKIMFRHMTPNIIAPTIVNATMGVGRTIIGAAGLSFLGLGIQPPTPEWGAMLAEGRNQILQYPYLLVFPGLMIAITVLSVNLLGDGLRDALDPKLKD